MDIIIVAVGGLTDLSALVPAVQDLSRRHAVYYKVTACSLVGYIGEGSRRQLGCGAQITLDSCAWGALQGYD